MRARALLAFLAVAILLGSSPLQADPVHQWSKRFGDTSGPQGGNSVAIDASGNVILLGAFVGTVDFGGGPLTNTSPNPFALDIFLAKFDANGGYLWSHRFGDVGTDYGTAVAVDSFGLVSITGSFEGTVDFGGGPLTSAGGQDIYLAQFDANGNHRWSYRFGNGRPYLQQGQALATDTFRNVILTGGFDGTVSFGGPSLMSSSDSTSDIFVAKFDLNGAPMWSKRFGDVDSIPPGADVGYAVTTDHVGNILVGGSFDGRVNFGGGTLASLDSTSSFFVKLDGAGNHVWSQSFGDWGFARTNSIAVDGSNNVIATGSFWGVGHFGGDTYFSIDDTPDIFVVKFFKDGDYDWSHAFGDADADTFITHSSRRGRGPAFVFGGQFGRSIAVDNAGDCLISGTATGTVDFGGGPLIDDSLSTNTYYAKFDSDGNHIVSRRFLGDGGAYSSDCAMNGVGDLAFTGEYTGNTVDFGGGPLTIVGGSDILLARLNEAPNPVLITRFEAIPIGNSVHVGWDVWSDEDLESFALYRGDDARPQPIVIAQGAFNASVRSYDDAKVEVGKTYRYELLIRSRDGGTARSPVATATVPTLQAALSQNFPNPFNPKTTIEYTLAKRSEAVVNIYDASGALVAQLNDGVRDAGTHRMEWDGRNQAGKPLSSGVYFYRLEGVKGLAARKMTLLN